MQNIRVSPQPSGRQPGSADFGDRQGFQAMHQISTSPERGKRPLSARRARHEARQAGYSGKRLPAGHPYAVLPTWMPYFIARVFGMIDGLVRRQS
ncbi:hypothetical protein SAMN02745172_04376 [Pseudoxanthobacter soli DSM 19599]|uniref:Uncharacterized protein n=2 Tax=Pseudoxanthobacter TaxID=433838 RepID=A0A1M7ZS32_9HYPH|nr:hypothetical protein SAMN02745172_04376 [Pseudoxanthobacter soli DSM 19599]